MTLVKCAFFNRGRRPRLVLLQEEQGWSVQLQQGEELLQQAQLPQQEWEELLPRLEAFLAQAPRQPRELVLLLASTNVVQLLMSLPQATPQELEKMLPWELMAYLSGTIEAYAYSYLVVEQTEEGQQLLVQALPREELSLWQQRSGELHLSLTLCRGRLQRDKWPQELPLPQGREQLAALNLCPAKVWQCSWQWRPCCQVLSLVLVLCSLSTWGCLAYREAQLAQQQVVLTRQLQELEPWPQRYAGCVAQEEELHTLKGQLRKLEQQSGWSPFLRSLGQLLPREQWLHSLHQRSGSGELELVGVLAQAELPRLLTSLEQLPQVRRARLLSTEARGSATSYRILVEVTP